MYKNCTSPKYCKVVWTIVQFFKKGSAAMDWEGHKNGQLELKEGFGNSELKYELILETREAQIIKAY